MDNGGGGRIEANEVGTGRKPELRRIAAPIGRANGRRSERRGWRRSGVGRGAVQTGRKLAEVREMRAPGDESPGIDQCESAARSKFPDMDVQYRMVYHRRPPGTVTHSTHPVRRKLLPQWYAVVVRRRNHSGWYGAGSFRSRALG